MLRLERPSKGLESSYRSLVEEIRRAGEPPVPYTLGYPFEQFDALIERLQKDEKGVDLPQNFVPSSTFWLVRDGVQIVGASNLRHRLTPNLSLRGGHIGYGVRPSARNMGYGREILKHMLPAARDLGLSKVLITCGKANVASAKIIAACGGVLDSEEFIPADSEIVQRYWIDLEIRA
jgi:predicted acetyltransferase